MHIKHAHSRLRWSPIVAVTAIALLVALSGSATAAVMIGGQQIKKNAIGTKHIKNNAVTGKEIKKNAIKPGHISPKAKKMLAGQDGADGAQGIPGKDGVDGVSGYEIVHGDEVTIAAGGSSELSVDCTEEKRAISGGASSADGFNPNSVIYESTVMGPTGFGWQVGVKNTGGGDIVMQAHAICVDAAS